MCSDGPPRLPLVPRLADHGLAGSPWLGASAIGDVRRPYARRHAGAELEVSEYQEQLICMPVLGMLLLMLRRCGGIPRATNQCRMGRHDCG